MRQTYKALCAIDMDWEASQTDLENWDKDPVTYEPELVQTLLLKQVLCLLSGNMTAMKRLLINEICIWN